MALKVLQVLPTLSAGGAEGFISNLGVGLVSLGVEVKFFLLAGVRRARGQTLLTRLQHAGIDVVGVEERRTASLSNTLRLARLIRTWRPDIVQANLYSCEVACATAKLLSFGRDTCYVRRLAGTASYRSRTAVQLLDRFYRQTIACSPAVAEAYRKITKGRFSSQLMTVPNGGVFPDELPGQKEKLEARMKLGIPVEAFVVAHIGRMLGGVGGGVESEAKAQDVLLKAFAQAFGGHADCRLVLLGDGPLRRPLEALARDLHISEQVRFLGEEPEPWPTLSAADVFCFPSRYEGLPNALVEAASCGLPIVASDIPEINTLRPDDSWQLVPVNDVSGFATALQTVRTNIEALAQRAHGLTEAFRARFSMRNCAERYLQAYELALG